MAGCFFVTRNCLCIKKERFFKPPFAQKQALLFRTTLGAAGIESGFALCCRRTLEEIKVLAWGVVRPFVDAVLATLVLVVQLFLFLFLAHLKYLQRTIIVYFFVASERKIMTNSP